MTTSATIVDKILNRLPSFEIVRPKGLEKPLRELFENGDLIIEPKEDYLDNGVNILYFKVGWKERPLKEAWLFGNGELAASKPISIESWGKQEWQYKRFPGILA